MQFRVATQDDLLETKTMYSKLIEKMYKDGIEIWDNIYPCELFANDIEHENLYIMLKSNTIVGAFALCEEHSGEHAVKWQKTSSKAVYIDRLGVNVNFAKQGIATELLNFARKIAIEKDFECLRLFVVDFNMPAINLYKKFGFKQADGIYTEIIDETLSFDEIGYEVQL